MITGLSLDAVAVQRGERVLFEGLSARLASGEAVIVSGRNGAGKTSLLRAIAGFIVPVAGAVTFSGPRGLLDPAEARSTDCHVVAHQDGLEGDRLARDEMMFQAHWFGAASGAAQAAADRLGVAGVLDLEVRRLSEGQRRRLALVRLAAAPRSLWLLDEPMAALDADGRAAVAEMMRAHLSGGGLLVAATHDALPFATQRLELAG